GREWTRTYVVTLHDALRSIVDSHCGIQLWAERWERQCNVQRDERNNDYELGSKQHHGHGTQRSYHRQCGGDGGGRGSEQGRDVHGGRCGENYGVDTDHGAGGNV